MNGLQKQFSGSWILILSLPRFFPRIRKEKWRSYRKAAGKWLWWRRDQRCPGSGQSRCRYRHWAGTDVAIESADIVLMKNDLLDVVTAVGLSKAVIRNIKENLFWAFFYNVCGIPLAAGVFYTAFGLKLSPMFGAAAMSLSSLFVVSNALRLRFFHVLKKPQQEENIRSAEVNTEQTVNTAAKAADNKEEMNMYTMKIEGMMCPHCQAAVTKALNGIEGVKAEVNLEKKEAYVEAPDSVSKEDLTKAVVDDAGYEVVSVE